MVKAKKETNKKEKNPSNYNKFIGKEINDGGKIIDIFEKEAKIGKVLEVRTDKLVSFTVAPEELKDYIK